MLPAHFLDQFNVELAWATFYTNQDYRMASTAISRLKDKLGKAAGVAQRVATTIEAEADSLIAQEGAMQMKTTEAFAPHKAILAEATTELKAIEDALNLMSNGGPALDPLSESAASAPNSAPPPLPSSDPKPTVDAIHDDTGNVIRPNLSI